MKRLLSHYYRFFTQPKQTLVTLENIANPISTGLFFISIPIIGYTLMYVLLAAAGGAPSSFEPWLNIPKSNYYYWNQFLLAPSMLLCWLTTSSFIVVTGKALGGKGSFEQTMLGLSLAIAASMLFGLLHDLPMSILSFSGIINAKEHEIAMNSATIWRTILWTFYSAYGIAFLFYFTKTVQAVQQLSIGKSIAIGTLAFMLFQMLFLIFNR